jgi:hypothetical protein
MLHVLHVIQIIEVLLYIEALHVKALHFKAEIVWIFLKNKRPFRETYAHTFVNTLFHFRINASIVAFLSNHISFGSILFIFCRPCCCHACCLAWSTRIMFHPRNAGSLIDDVRRDIAIHLFTNSDAILNFAFNAMHYG